MPILLEYGFLKETLTIIMILYEDTEEWVSSPNGVTNIIDIVTGDLQVNTLALLLFIFSLDFVL